ncbi:hypothetical protein TeGR_g11457, partial [Tetraparma gracilis]
GHFTPWTKFLSTFKTMAKMYAVFGVIGGVLVGIMISGGYFHSMDALQVTVKALSNTGGLVVIVFLLGYGLVEFPRYLWQAADLEKQLLLTQMAAASEFKNFSEVSLKCSMSVADVVCTTAAAKKTHNEMLIHACNVIRDDCPKEFHSGSAGTVRANKLGNLSLDTLADLRKQLNKDASAFNISKSKIERIKTRAYYLEDLVNCRDTGTIEWSFEQGEASPRMVKWMYFWRPIVLRSGSVALGLLSFAFLLAYIGVMTGYNSGISFFTIIVHHDTSHVGGIT